MEKAKETSSNHAGIGIIKITNIKIMAIAKNRSPRLVELTNISLKDFPNIFDTGPAIIHYPKLTGGTSNPSS